MTDNRRAVRVVPRRAIPVAVADGGDGMGEQHGRVLRFLEANYELARWLVAPPKTDPAVLHDWRAAFDATVGSEEFLEESKKLDMPIAPMSGADLAKRIGEIMSDEEGLRADLGALPAE